MKTGQPKQRLSEKLNADMEQMRSENVALMQSQLESFRSDLKTTAESALAIIKTDMETYLLSVRKHLLIQSNKSTRPDPNRIFWMLGVSVLVMISSGLSIWAMGTILKPSLTSLGIRLVETPEAMFLVPNSDQVSLTQCRIGARSVDCLKVEGQ